MKEESVRRAAGGGAVLESESSAETAAPFVQRDVRGAVLRRYTAALLRAEEFFDRYRADRLDEEVLRCYVKEINRCFTLRATMAGLIAGGGL